MYLPVDAENALVDQKNRILSLVNDEQFEEAILILDFLAPLWKVVGYGYKTREIRERIQREIQTLQTNATHHKTAEKWERLSARVA